MQRFPAQKARCWPVLQSDVGTPRDLLRRELTWKHQQATIQSGWVQQQMADLFSFPNPVNEVAARVVAGGVLALATVALALSLTVDPRWLWLTAVLAYGFVARVLTGPTLSPLGQLATRVVAPRIAPPKYVPGPPKRFAQGIGAVLTVGAAILYGAFGQVVATQLFLGLVIVAATLESVFAVCIGCIVFGWLQRHGFIPEDVCEACNDITRRYAV